MPNPNQNYRGSGGRTNTNQLNQIPFRKEWITQGIDEEAIQFAYQTGEVLKEGDLTTSQIRNIFGEMRRIQMVGYERSATSFLLLKPRLAYNKKRMKSDGLDKFYDLFALVYEHIDKKTPANGKKHFDNAMHLFEAILAYHKFHGGK